MLPDFTREADANRAPLAYYAASSGNFLPTFRENPLVKMVKNPNSWPFKMGPIDFPETSARNYHYSPRNNPEEDNSC